MTLLQSDDFLNYFEDLIHLDTQQHEHGLDLTVSEIHEFTGVGSLDFGGSEFEEASTRQIKAEKLNPGDDYGWWQLDEGTYKAVCNESLKIPAEAVAIVTPHEHARKAGLLVNTSVVADSNEEGHRLSLTFRVPQAGCNIKENARFASVYMLSE